VPVARALPDVAAGAMMDGDPRPPILWVLPVMHLHGFIMSAELGEVEAGSDEIELTLRVQGVGPGQPRRIVVPYPVLLADPSIDADDVVGRGFEAEVTQAGPSRWEVSRLALAARVLRSRD